ncbi:MAG TPA: choice-of-anchor tandem repeat GloVer-containing protein [Terriglobales bacterium]|nr:choice-of-anchor tandem repeat GloVer-containing protein [Terriglobales bacterium]
MKSIHAIFLALLTTVLLLPAGAWAASSENVLYTFQGGSDCAPYGSLILDAAGNLYGTTYGGRGVNGEVYKLSPDGGTYTKTTIYSFAGGSDGRNPVLGLVRDTAGNLYGTTPIGGTANRGVVYELSPNGSGWTETVLYAFSGGNDGAIPYSGVIFDQAGNLYGTASQGGANGNGVVFKLTPGANGWTESVLYAFTGGNDGSWPQGNILFDPAGNLYGATMQGGVDGWGTAYKLIPANGGWTEATLYGFTNGDDGSQPQAGLIRHPSGVLYGTANGGGSGQAGVVFQLRPYPTVQPNATAGWQETPIYSFTGGNDGAGSDTGMVFDQAGNLDGTAQEGGSGGFGVVYQLTPGSSGWTQNLLYSFTGGSDGGFPESTVALDSAGNLYGTTVAGGAGCGVVYQIVSQR